MDKVKRYIIYVLLLIGFAIFTEFLIAVGLNSTYKQIANISDLPEGVNIVQTEATTVNGRIRGTVTNSEDNPAKGKYLKFDFFTERNVNMGSKYIELDKSKTEIPFEAFFKLNNVSYYKVSFANEKPSQSGLDLDFLKRDLTDQEIFWTAFIGLMLLPVSYL